MLGKKIVSCLVLILFFGNNLLWADDLNLEDINFPFDSAAVVDDLKQIPRLVEKLKSDPELKVEISGYTDSRGSAAYNDRLSMRRADAVKQLLLTAGIAPGRISVTGYGKGHPKQENSSGEGRFVNRRAVFSIYKLVEGKKDYYYRDNAQVKPFETEARLHKQQPEVKNVAGEEVCVAGAPCSEEGTAAASKPSDLSDILKRLDRIEESIGKKEPAHPAEATTAGEGGKMPVEELATGGEAVPGSLRLIDGKMGSLSLGLGGNDGYFSGSVEGRLFVPITDAVAFQGGATGSLSDYLKEFQFDAGFVGKYKRLQLGAFGSTKLARLKGFDETGNLSQLSIAASYLFDRGSLGAFFTKALKSEDVIETEQHYEFSDLVTTETYLKSRDRMGLNFDYLFANGISVEGDFGVMRADNADTTGRMKVGYPLSESLRMFAQGGFNTGLIREKNDLTGLVGLEIGNWRSQNVAMVDGIRPMQIPDISYEMKTRTKVLKSGVNLVPVVAISASALAGPPPLTVTFTGTATDPDGKVESMAWDFGDGAVGTGSTVTHTFNKAGSYLVTLTAVDNKGDKGSANIQITVKESVNLLPVVSITASAVGGAHPLTVTFKGSATDPDGRIESLSWDFGDGASATGDSATHTFTKAGIYLITLTATDNGGGKASANLQVAVGNEVPVAFAGADRTVKVYSDVVLDGSRSYDPDGDNLTYQWRQVSGRTVSLVNADRAVADVILRKAGVYVFQLAVTDGQGGIGTSTVTVTVLN